MVSKSEMEGLEPSILDNIHFMKVEKSKHTYLYLLSKKKIFQKCVSKFTALLLTFKVENTRSLKSYLNEK